MTRIGQATITIAHDDRATRSLGAASGLVAKANRPRPAEQIAIDAVTGFVADEARSLALRRIPGLVSIARRFEAQMAALDVEIGEAARGAERLGVDT